MKKTIVLIAALGVIALAAACQQEAPKPAAAPAAPASTPTSTVTSTVTTTAAPAPAK